MLKKDWKKNLLRMRQRADQGLGRVEKSEVLSEELLTLEKRVEVIRQVYHNTQKKVGSCLQTAGVDPEKRLKKMPECNLAVTLSESASVLGVETLLGQMFQLCGTAINTVAKDLLQYEVDVDKTVLSPIQNLLDNEIPAIQKQRKHLNNMTIDRDVARGRYQSVVKQNNSGNAAKKDTVRDEMEDTEHRVEQCRDQFSTDMYAFLARESEYSNLLLELIKAQVQFHQRSLDTLERLLPQMEEQIGHSTHSPVYCIALEEHLRRTNRDIAAVLEDCICTLFEVGMEEEGLFRVAGTSSKVKKLKAAFDYGMVDMTEHVRDIHCVADALKLYLRELPEPLMTYKLHSEWMHAAHLPQDQKLQALWVVLNKLPRENYNNLRYLIKFLSKLAEKEEVNKMSPSNIAIVMGPNLMWAPPEDGGPSVLNTSIQSAIVELLITHADWFFVEDIDFHKTGHGMSLERRTSSVPPPLPVTSGQSTLPRTRPRSTHALNSAFTVTQKTLTAPLTPAQQHERSQSVPPFSTLPRTPPRSSSMLQKAATPLVNGGGAGRDGGAGRSDGGAGRTNGGGVGRTSKLYTGIGAASATAPLYRSHNDKDEKSGSSLSSDDSVGASSSRRPSLRTVKDNMTADSTSLGGGDTGPKYHTYHHWNSDSISEPGSLGHNLTKGDNTVLTRSTTPPPKPPPPKSVHSDVYNTVFALHSLGQNDGWSEYLTTVRGMLDGHMCKRSSKEPSSSASSSSGLTAVTPTNGGGAASEVDFSGPATLTAASQEVVTTNGSGTAQPYSTPSYSAPSYNAPSYGTQAYGNQPYGGQAYGSQAYGSQPGEVQPTTPVMTSSQPSSLSSSMTKSVTPPESLSSSNDNLLLAGSPESSVGGVSPRAPRRGKKPAPLPPPSHGSSPGGGTGGGIVNPAFEKPAVAEKPQLLQSVSTISSASTSSSGGEVYSPLYPSLERTGATSPTDRPQVPPPAPPGGKPERPEKPAIKEKPSSPVDERPRGNPPERPAGIPPERPAGIPPERPAGIPPERPSMPPPEKPDRPPSITLNDKQLERPERPEKPAKPGDYGSLTRHGSGRPPRPQPPPPPPPDRKTSLEKSDKQAPLAVAEDDDGVATSPDPTKSEREETHL